MSLFYLILLALIQGVTEFLPISSSAHLILPAKVFGWPDQGPMIDVMAHFGTLFAVVLYFRKDVGAAITGFFDLIRARLNARSALALNLMLATPPALILGAALHFGGLDEALRSPLIIAITTIVFGVLLWLSDLWGKREKDDRRPHLERSHYFRPRTIHCTYTWHITLRHHNNRCPRYGHDPCRSRAVFHADEYSNYCCWQPFFHC